MPPGESSSPLFTGAAVQRRPINLGGQQGSASNSQESLVERARKEREGREEQRRRERAAAKIQAFLRGRSSAASTKAQLRLVYDDILATRSSDPEALLKATRLLVLIFGERNQEDLKRVALWCRAMLGTAAGSSDKVPLLFALYSTSGESWSVLIRQMSFILFCQAAKRPSISPAPLFLEITKILCDPNSFVKYKVANRRGRLPIEYLAERGFYSQLRGLLLSVPPEQRTHPALPAAIALSVLPFKAFPALSTPTTPVSSRPATPTTSSPQRTEALHSFTLAVLTVPLLAHRIPLNALTSLLSALPLEAIFLEASNSPSFANSLAALEPDKAAHLLANVLAIAGKRVSTFSNGKVLAGYLTMLATLLDRLPSSVFTKKKHETEESSKGKEREVIIIDDSDDEEDTEAVRKARERVGAVASVDQDGDATMSAPNPAQQVPTSTLNLDSRTEAFLEILASREHLTSVLGLSTRFSSSTRPALASFTISLLSTWHAKRDEVLNIIMYSQVGVGGAAGERGGGLLRELFRGYIRSGPLGKLLAASADRGYAVIQALEDKKLASDWATLILLAELYSRCLLTLGDDEFFDPKRNPLTLDEVVGLSGVLRNLAFILYWQEGAVLGDGGAEERKVVGTRMGRERLRTLVTTLLQQIYARDSRRAFTPEGHWLMTSQFDLASFVQTAIYEDQKLDADEAEENEGGSSGRNHRDDDEDDEDEGPRRRPRHQSTLAKSRAGLSKRQLAFVSPRLGVLNNIPFVIPFETRVAVFRQFVENDRARLGFERHRYDRRQRSRAVIRRTSISEDAYAHLNGLGAALKGTIEIVFINQFGEEESGIDGGGLFKELLTSLSKEAFDTDRGLWLATKDQELYPNPHSYARESNQLSWYTFIGRILGKALYEGILIDVRFASFFLSKWLGRQSYLDDLISLDPELYNGLMILKNYTGDVEADLSLNFTVTDEDFGVSRTIDLIPGGSDIAVTSENRIQYIYLMSHYRLNVQLEKQCSAFFAGLSEIIPPRFLAMFNQSELRVLVGGVDRPIDIADLKANTVYGGWDGEEANSTIQMFWRVVNSFDKDQRSALVRFVTSCARPPLLGFSELNPRFAIRNAGSDQTRLPTASTCVCLLKLPEYADERTLREKLLYAINSDSGFDLS